MLKGLVYICIVFTCFGVLSSEKVHLLPSNFDVPAESIFSVYQSDNGSLWIGSDSGLINYKNDERRVFLPEKDGGLLSPLVKAISSVDDNPSKLWLGTKKGLQLFDIDKEEFSSVADIDEEHIDFINADVRRIITIGKGRKLIHLHRKGLYELVEKNNSIKKLPWSDMILERVGLNEFPWLYDITMKNNKIYILSTNSKKTISLIIISSNKIEKVIDSLPGEIPTAIEFKDDNIYLFKWNGINSIDVKNLEKNGTINAKLSDNLPGSYVRKAIKYNDTIFILTTENGLYEFDGKNIKKSSLENKSQKTYYNAYIDKDNMMWLMGGDQLLQRAGPNYPFIKAIGNSAVENKISAVDVLNGQFTIGTSRGVAKLTSEMDFNIIKTIETGVSSLYTKNDLVIVGSSKGLTLYDSKMKQSNEIVLTKDGDPSNLVVEIIEHDEKSIYVKLADNSLRHLVFSDPLSDGSANLKLILNKKITVKGCSPEYAHGDYFVCNNEPKIISTSSNKEWDISKYVKRVIKVYRYDENLWITGDEGLVRFNMLTEELETFELDLSQTGARISAVYPIDNHLLIGGNFGITLLDIVTKELYKLDQLFFGRQTYGNWGFYHNDGQLALEDGNNLYLVDIQSFKNYLASQNSVVPKLITAKYNESIISNLSNTKLDIPYEKSALTIDYAVPSEINNSLLLIAYSLDGKNDWSPLKLNRGTIKVNDLSSGSHLLQLRAKTFGNGWTYSTPLAIDVAYPWYLSQWAITVYIILLIAALYLIYSGIQILPDVIKERNLSGQLKKDREKLNKAIQQGFIRNYYQPIVDTQKGVVVGYEVLSRWIENNVIKSSPKEFIPMAEACGLIYKLTNCNIDRLIDCVNLLFKNNKDLQFISVNLSVEILSNDQQITSIIKKINKKLSAKFSKQIVFEITETTLISEAKQVSKNIKRLKSAGFKLALDDFGTGQSSLSHIQQFPIDKIKIDRSFITSITKDSKDYNIVKSLRNLCKNLSMELIAEGVESKSQERLLTELNITTAQGFLYSKPLPLKRIL